MYDNNLGIAVKIILMGIALSIILLFVGIGILVLIHACIVGNVIRRVVENIGPDNGNVVVSGMSKEDVEKLPCFHYESWGSKGEKGSPIPCSICLEGFQKGERCRSLPKCKHNFHAQCVDSWLMKAPACPVCRAAVSLKGKERKGSPSGGGNDLEMGEGVVIGFPVSPVPLEVPGTPLLESPRIASPMEIRTPYREFSRVESPLRIGTPCRGSSDIASPIRLGTPYRGSPCTASPVQVVNTGHVASVMNH